MPRIAMILLLLLILAGGLLYFLSASVDEVPLAVIEENVVANGSN